MADASSATPWPLVAQDVCLTLGGRVVLHPSTLVLDQRSIHAVLGPNGAGKSTLLRVLHGLLNPDAGEVRWAGGAPAALTQAMVFQRPVLLRRSVLANLEYALARQRVAHSERRARALRMLERTHLGHLAHAFARTLSIGEQQLVALARAWVLEPSILFLDEPTASLDPASAHHVESLIGQIGEAGTTIVLVTHQPALARRLSSDVVFIAEGRVREHTPAREFFAQPRSPEARRYLEQARL